MDRKVEIYKIDYSFLPMFTANEDEEESLSIFIRLINQIDFEDDTYEINYNEQHDSTVIIELLEINDEYLFGIIAKLENLKAGLLKRLREVSNKEVIEEDDQEELGLYLENYTYFYVCKETLFCSVLSNTAAPRFRTHFENFLIENIDMNSIENISVNVVIDDNISYKINEVTNIETLDLNFSKGSRIGSDLLSLTSSFGISQSAMRDARISINLEAAPVGEQTKSIFNRIKELKDNFKKVEVVGADKDDNLILMELVDQVLMKRVNINIEDKLLTSSKDINVNLRQIKKALAGSLISI